MLVDGLSLRIAGEVESTSQALASVVSDHKPMY